MAGRKIRNLGLPPKIGRPGISSLPLPAPRFDLRQTPEFEAETAVADEDRLRAAMLRRRAKVKRRQARSLLRLADAIDPEVAPHPTTPASSRYMRDQRIRIFSAIWELIHGR